MKKNKISLTVDLDDWYHASMVSGAEWSHFKTINSFFKNWKQRFDYLTEPTIGLLNLLDELNINATFFIIADIVDKYPEIIKKLKNSNHEITCHSLHHTIPYNTKTKKLVQSKNEWEQELVESKNILEETFEKEIIGYRAPGAFLAEWMLPILYKNKFIYDSSVSINSFYNKTDINFTYYKGNPFYWNGKGNEWNLLEIPWPNLKILNLYFPGGGAFFFRIFGYKYFKTLLNQNLNKGNTTFYIHSLDISNEQFPISNFKKRPFYWINKGDKTYNNLYKLLLHYRELFTTNLEICKNIGAK